MIPKIAGLVTSCGEGLTPHAISSLAPWVDDIIVLVDTKAPPGFAESLGVEWHPFVWCDDFAAMYNAGAALLKDRCYWTLSLDADEQLYDGGNLRRVVASAEAEDAEAVNIPTRHFHDLERTRECQNPSWFPDLHPRLKRPHVMMGGRVHQGMVGEPRTIMSSLIFVEHYNLAVRTEEQWRTINAFYDRLGATP